MRTQRGGFAMGLIVGLLLGLALALAVALYVTKTPVPFVNKVPQRSAEKDAAEIERNKNWDPNAPLLGKSPAHGASAPGSASNGGAMPNRPPVDAGAAAVRPARDPAAILAGEAAGSAPRMASTKPGTDPFVYFVQVGAFTKTEDAEQKRAGLAMLGFTAKVTEREQSGRTMFRVRLGPYQLRDEAESAQTKLQLGGETAALVRVER